MVLEGVVKVFYPRCSEPVRVLEGVNWTVRAGECVSIRGASGSGKSTLLHVAAGLDNPSIGEVFWGRHKLSHMSSSQRASWRGKHLGFVFQSFHLMEELTAWENVCLPMALVREDGRKRARELLEEVGLGHRLNHRPGELSGGEQQRVAIARALIRDPKVIFADEPTGNLDRTQGERLVKLLLDLTRSRGKALVMATHDPVVAELADRKMVLRDGILKSNEV